MKNQQISLREIINKISEYKEWKRTQIHYIPLFIEEAKTGKDWKEWDSDVFFNFFEKSGEHCISSLKQGNFSNKDKEEIKKNWAELAPLFQILANNQTEPNWDCYKEIKNVIRSHTSNEMKAATNRLIVALQPQILCTIVSESHLKLLYDFLESINCSIEKYHNNNWFINSNNIARLFNDEFREISNIERISFPWLVYEYFTDNSKINEPINNDVTLIKRIIDNKKQIILQGAPGTGKTYITAEVALSILGIEYEQNNHQDVMEKYHDCLKSNRIAFTTFHQSLDYEDFVEGLKPCVDESHEISYEIKDGIFKNICKNAEQQGNLDKFEKALEDFKMKCASEEEEVTAQTKRGTNFSVTYRGGTTFKVRSEKSQADKDKDFPASINLIKEFYKGNEEKIYNSSYVKGICDYLKREYKLGSYVKQEEHRNYVLIIDEINRGNISKIFGELITLIENDKRMDAEHPIEVILPYSQEKFMVPSNLYIIGTMNTTDRSVGTIDYAIRRRFAFYTLKASKDAIKVYYSNISEGIQDIAINLFEKVYDFVESNKISDYSIDDLMIGHSYFMAKSLDELTIKFNYEILPLLSEYEKDGIISISEKQSDNLLNDTYELNNDEWKQIFQK